MASGKPPKIRGLRFGEKVTILLKRNGQAGIEPSTPKALADALGEENPRVYRALQSSAPKLDLAFKIARALGESLDFLANPDRDFASRTPGERWESFVAVLTPAELDSIADAARSPDVRRLLIAYAERGRGGPSAPPATPTGSRP